MSDYKYRYGVYCGMFDSIQLPQTKRKHMSVADTELVLGDNNRKNLTVSLFYPDYDDTQTIECDLMAVRRADSIRITYDFKRDGWVILQASRFMWSYDDPVCDMDWQEVAFIEAWGREETEEEAQERMDAFDDAK